LEWFNSGIPGFFCYVDYLFGDISTLPHAPSFNQRLLFTPTFHIPEDPWDDCIFTYINHQKINHEHVSIKVNTPLPSWWFQPN